MSCSDLDVVYIRNWDLKKDYEVTVIHGSYVDLGGESVGPLGVDDDEDWDEEEEDEQ